MWGADNKDEFPVRTSTDESVEKRLVISIECQSHRGDLDSGENGNLIHSILIHSNSIHSDF